MTMRRDDALEILIPHIRNDDIVVTVYQSCFDWLALCPRPLNYVSVGAMGQASSHGLGLALANPDRRIIIIDGDGSLLMNLGSLVTIANAKPTNLYHFLAANRIYEVNGAHPIPGADIVVFEDIARAAGYAGAKHFDNLDSLKKNLPEALSALGPQMLVLEIVPGNVYPPDYEFIHSAEVRESFRLALNQS